MNNSGKATSTFKVYSTLPNYIAESYDRFVTFMESVTESSERLGFGTDILQNLLKYRDFDTYKNELIEFSYLADPYNATDESVIQDESLIAAAVSTPILATKGTFDQGYAYILTNSENKILKLTNTYGFPDENGVIMIDDEIILYRYKVGNYFYDLRRGAAGTHILPTFTQEGTYEVTEPAEHLAGAKVYNLSVLFLVSMLETIHDSFTPDIHSSRVHEDVNRSSLLKYIKDFYKSKGTKLGIKALFKFLFAQNDVEVSYPGDRMIVPSKSTWNDSEILRTVPIPSVLCDWEENSVTPAKLINSELTLRSYLDDKVYARVTCDYISSYPYEDEVQYEMYVQNDSIKGTIIANPNTVLTRDLNRIGTIDDKRDVTTITVETTLGFPDSGIVFIDNEAIRYTSKSFNQFFGCIRGHIGVEVFHQAGASVYGPYYIEGRYTENDEEYVSRSWPLGLVESVRILEPGLLHTVEDEVFVNGPGLIDPREPIMESFVENTVDLLAEQSIREPKIAYIGNYSAAVTGVYFDDRHVFASSTNLPYYSVGPFGSDIKVGKFLRGYNQLNTIPRREEIQPNTVFDHKGTNRIGVFADGVSAFSNVSSERIVSGKIAKIDVVSTGYDYVTPTLIVAGYVSPADFVIQEGKIVSVTETDPKNHTYSPVARISTGEDGEIDLTFDPYGRVVDAVITRAGKFYNDTPYISVVDSSKRGKGALLKCEVSEGELQSVEIVHAGIDYNATATRAIVVPIGDECILDATVQYYELDRVYQIENKRNWQFDKGNGFIFEDYSKDRTAFGYLGSPTDVLERKGEDQINHSPLIGYAFDGNPIYGCYGYKNGKNNDDGIIKYYSGYVLRSDRSEIIAGGGDEVGTKPPLESQYAMGTFVQDYTYDKELATLRRYLLNSEHPLRLKAESQQRLNVYDETLDIEQILDTDNGRICNTPEYPAELYPDGVFCYFATTDIDESLLFPYIMGPTFKNRPISQNLLVNDQEKVNAITYSSTGVYDPNVWYDNTKLEFDFKKVERFRNSDLSETRDEVQLKIGEISKGGISQVLVEDDRPITCSVGDFVYFDNTDTRGSGAEAKISHVGGSDVNRAFGIDLETVVVSHDQRIDLSHYNDFSEVEDFTFRGGITTEENPYELVEDPEEFDYLIYEDDGTNYEGRKVLATDWLIYDGSAWVYEKYQRNGNFVFTEGSKIRTSTDAEATVLQWNIEKQWLDVRVTTPNLVMEGDVFYDNLGKLARVRYTYDPFVKRFVKNQQVTELITHIITESGLMVLLEDSVSSLEVETINYAPEAFIHKTSAMYTTFSEPSGSKLNEGDFWYSHQNGRLYIWYQDEDSMQWVCTQPIGMRPLNGASDTSIGNTTETTNFVDHYGKDNTITISRLAPSSRADGTQNRYSDLWWSSHTGILYMWNNDSKGSFDMNVLEGTGEWICTDPNARVPNQYASDEYEFVRSSSPSRAKTFPIYAGVSEIPPTEDVEEGTLWWSTLTAKLYIRYDDQWVVSNPVAIMPTKYAGDEIIDGGGGTGGGGGGTEIPPVGPLPETDVLGGKSEIWFKNLKYFIPGDSIRFNLGAPGTGLSEDAILEKILKLGPPDKASVIRGTNPVDLPDGTPTLNTTRSLYVLHTDTPHGMRKGDTIKIENSLYEEVNNTHQIIDAGVVQPAVGEAVVSNGEVVEVIIKDPGKYYTENCYVYFYGGGGQGAYGYAEVAPLKEGGGIQSVTMIESGYNYVSSPKVIFGTELTNKMIVLYMSETYGEDPSIIYSTTKENIIGPSKYIKVTSPGVGYESLPLCVGYYKRFIDRAVTKITLDGTRIGSINVESGGRRYYSPIAIIEDMTNNGSGAHAVVSVRNGVVTDIEVTKPGEGYVEPYITLVEDVGKQIALTNDIGKIKSLRIINPGRNISPDPSLKPELQITTRCVITDPVGYFVYGQEVYQGIEENKQVVGIVDVYDVESQLRVISTEDTTEAIVSNSDEPQSDEAGILANQHTMSDTDRQILTLVRVKGNLKDGEMIYGPTGSGMVVLEGQADCRIVVGGTSDPEGRFIDDTSKVSEKYPVIQDSYYYQWFSYSIASPLQQTQYKNFVNDIVHPAGFIMFSDLIVNEHIHTSASVEEIEIATNK